MLKYSIKDVEVLSGIKAHTLRIWELRYDIIEPLRTDTNIRYYSNEQLKKVLNISLLNNNGIKISKIATMSQKEINEHIKALQKLNNNVETYANRLTQAMISFDKQKLENILQDYKFYGSLESFFIDVIFPFLNRVGLLWASSDINPAQEHFCSQVIKRFLIKKIEEFPQNSSHNDLYVLLLPKEEYHELSLLFAEYILKSKGKNTIYLGTSVPYNNLNSLISSYNVKAIICVMVIQKSEHDMQEIIHEYEEISNTTKVYFAGNVFDINNYTINENIEVLRSLTDLKTI